MARNIDLLLAAMLATSAMAAPAPRKVVAKRSIFTVPVKARQMRAAADDMARVASKYASPVQDLLDVPEHDFNDAVSLGESIVSGINNFVGDLTSSLGLDDPFDIQPAASTETPSAASTALATLAAPVTSSNSESPTSQAPLPPTLPTSPHAPLPSSLSTFPPSAPPSMPTATLASFTTSSVVTGTPVASSAAASSTIVSSAVASSTASGEEGEVTTTPEANDIEYLSPVVIGGQTLTLDFDTGSSDLWVYSSELPSSDISNHSIYDPSKSSSWSEYPNATWSISYGDGSTASGSVGFDTVSIGGAVVNKQCVELADELSSTFLADTQSDGLLGLGFSSINTVQPQKQQTFFENIMAQLDQPLFTADLGDHAPGVYEFGTIDSTKMTGDVHYTDVDSSAGYWTISVPEYQINNQTFTSQTTAAIADTGTSLLYMNQDAVDAYYKDVQGAGLSTDTGAYTYPCGAALPDFGVSIGGYFAVIKGADMTYETVDGSQCFGGLQIVPQGANFQILGDMFLKQFLAVFDGGNLRFGVAERA